MRFYQQLKNKDIGTRKLEIGVPQHVQGQKGPNNNEEWGPGKGMFSRPFPVMG